MDPNASVLPTGSVSVFGIFFGIFESRYGIRYRYCKLLRYWYFRIHISYKTENIDFVVIGVVI